MGRQVPGYADGIRTYVPSAFGNREDPEPIEVDIDQPFEGGQREMEADTVDKTRVVLGEDGKPERDERGRMRLEMDAHTPLEAKHRAITRRVRAVRRYLAANGTPITNGAELARYGETPIVDEVYAEIRKGAAWGEAEKKRSGARSASSAPETKASGGTAASAGAPASMSSAAAG